MKRNNVFFKYFWVKYLVENFDIAIFAVVVGLGLLAVWATGNWDRMMKILMSLDREFIKLWQTICQNIGDVANIVESVNR